MYLESTRYGHQAIHVHGCAQNPEEFISNGGWNFLDLDGGSDEEDGEEEVGHAFETCCEANRAIPYLTLDRKNRMKADKSCKHHCYD